MISHGAEIKIKYFQKDERYIYRIELLKLALKKSINKEDQVIFQPCKGDMTQSRGLNFLKNRPDKINIAFLPTNKKREKNFLSIKKPILFGILGYRIFLIHKDVKQKFKNINSISPFIKGSFICGFGSQWADMKILKYNKIKVIGVAVYSLLFKMLNHKRFDYFPRGINEVWKEYDSKKDVYKNITVEKSLAFYYPYPVYFFVNKRNIELAYKIKKGLDIAEKDGSFRSLFLKYHKDIINRSKLSQRKIIILKNPEFNNDIKINSEWWLKKY